ncbi:putative regulator of nonsense transcripts [Triangularia setosa]|uniref:Regulator of nonsense transcripts n=1 Tax=Triangularia setosa TaxID=2587417 RepID=A0AAN6W6D8_9PEZI|nr:putative regulator of nonsense transcripts [Podospora setosa]
MSTPQLLSRKTNGTTAVAQSSADSPKATKTKAPANGEKVVIRRLPPGMTEEEYHNILGDEWKLGNGKVDWFSWCSGKVSQHPSKPSLPARAYLHVSQRDQLPELLRKVQEAKWEDAKETYNDPALVAPPTVEFSVYKKIPSDKKRVDGRQGTIDQDPEFMAFLESLASPDGNKEGVTAEPEPEEEPEKTTTTPLIEYLKEKKAAKAKELAAAKIAMKHARTESLSGKGKAPATSAEEPKRRSTRDRESRSERERATERAPEKPRESVKILTKKAVAAVEAAAEAAKVAAIQKSTQSSVPSASSEAPSKSRRAGIAAAARILQRDLGLSSSNAHRKARMDAAKADADNKGGAAKGPAKENIPIASEPAPPAPPAQPASSAPPKSQPAAPSNRSRNRRRGGGEEGGKSKGDNKADKQVDTAPPAPTPAPVKPVLLLKKREAPQAQPQQSSAPATPVSATAPQFTPTTAGPSQPNTPKNAPAKQGGGGRDSKKIAGPAPSSGATRAFVKHANHSQGVTEALLKEALSAYGTVTSVDIDRKKGFAYVDFADHAGLAKAMAASPVAVAQATVQVLERKDMAAKKGGQSSGSNQGKNAAASASTAPTPAPAAAVPSSSAAPEKAAGEQPPKENRRNPRHRNKRGRDNKEKDGKEGAGGKGGGGGGGSAPAAATVSG